MATSATNIQIEQILNIQGAFRALALLNMVGYLFPEDAKVSGKYFSLLSSSISN